jgi:hypothetical protein
MVPPNRLTIIPIDKQVYVNDRVAMELDLSSCGIPENIHALQWWNGKGWIEHTDHSIPQLNFVELPDWAIKCIEQFQIVYNDELSSHE